MLKNLLNLSARFMGSLRYGRKFTLIAALFVAPLLVVAFYFLKEIGSQADFASSELKGAAYHRPLAKMLFQALDLHGSVADGAAKPEAWTSLQQQFDALSAVEKTHGADLKTAESFGKVAKAFKTASETKALGDIDALVDSLSTLSGDVGDNSQLVLDPDIDTYYTADVFLNQIPTIAQKLGASRDELVAWAKSGKHPTAEQTKKIDVLNTQLNASLDTFKTDFDKAGKYNKGLKAGIEKGEGWVVKSSDSWFKYLDSDLSSRTWKTPEIKAGASAVTSSLASYYDSANSNTTDLLHKRKAGFENRRNMVLGIMLGFLVVAAYAFVGFYRCTKESISKLQEAAQSIAGGDLSQTPERTTNDEVGDLFPTFQKMLESLRNVSKTAEQIAAGDLTANIVPQSEHDSFAHSLTKMIDNLRGMVTDMETGAKALAETSSQLQYATGLTTRAAETMRGAVREVAMSTDQSKTASLEIARSCESQASSTTQASEAMERVTEAISVVRDAVTEQGEMVTKTNEVVVANERAVKDALKTISKINDEVQSSAVAIENLGAKGEEIGSIVDTINTIAEQTNLLALNAAIEAARAGEHGRGFAVVADEVRKLAERSAQSTTEISKLIGEVRAGVEEALTSMNRSTEQVKLGSTASGEAAKAIEQMSDSMKAVASQTSRLQESADKMDAGTRALRMLLGEIVESSQQTAAGAEELNATSNEVSENAERVANEIDHQSEAIKQSDDTAAELKVMADRFLEIVHRFQLEEASMQKAA